jgi:anaerobic magnesium-protoporphyrin IX monomethyl ester cyclase
LTTGLESGSQLVLDRMRKGTRIESLAEFLANATAAGISTRCTMILGYPGETAQDVALSARFLEDNGANIERVMLNRFVIMSGTRVHRLVQTGENHAVTDVVPDHAVAQLRHRLVVRERRRYDRAAMALYREVHRINRKPLLDRARDFEGVM